MQWQLTGVGRYSEWEKMVSGLWANGLSREPSTFGDIHENEPGVLFFLGCSLQLSEPTLGTHFQNLCHGVKVLCCCDVTTVS